MLQTLNKCLILVYTVLTGGRGASSDIHYNQAQRSISGYIPELSVRCVN